MNILGIVQVRMTSTRLPGKVLRKVNGQSLISWQMSRVSRSREVETWILATSADKSDDPIESFCKENGWVCERGPLADVAKRYGQVLKKNESDAFVRLSGDSPCMDPELIDTAARMHIQGHYQITTNIHRRTFPKGQSVEILDSDTFLKELPSISKPEHQEHVTPYFYEHFERFKAGELINPYGDDSGWNLSVDTEEDMRLFGLILDRLKDGFKTASWRDILQVASAIKSVSV